MNRSRINLVLDVLSFVLLAALLQTGLIMRYALPPGSGGRGGGPGLRVWGWTRHDWGDVHTWIAYALVATMAAHVVLHWTWVCVQMRRLVGRRHAAVPGRWWRWIAGAGALAATAALLVAPLWWTPTDTRGGGQRGIGAVAGRHGNANAEGPPYRRGRGQGWQGGRAGAEDRPGGGRGRGARRVEPASEPAPDAAQANTNAARDGG